MTNRKTIAHGPDGITSQWEFVTPEVAQEYLTRNIDNRGVKEVKLNRLITEMANDDYVTTHQGIAFDLDGDLRDGQHRLLAIISTRKGQDILVTRGLKKSAQRHMDRGASRLVSDFMADTTYPASRAAACRAIIAIRILGGKITPAALGQAMAQVTDSDIYRTFDQESDLHTLIDKFAAPSRAAAKFLPMGHAPVLAASVVFPDVAEPGLTHIATGIGFTKGSPLLALRNSALSGSHKANRYAMRQQNNSLYHTMRVFQMEADGASVSRLQFDASAEVIVPLP